MDAIYQAHQDPIMVQYLPVIGPYPRERAERFALGVAPEMWAEESGCAFAVADNDTGALLGSVGVPFIDYAAAQATVGYWVAPHGRGRGIATAGLMALSEWLFTHLGLASVLLLIEDHNAASVAVARKAGFEQQGSVVSYDFGERTLTFTHWVRYRPAEPVTCADPAWLSEPTTIARTRVVGRPNPPQPRHMAEPTRSH